MPLAVRLIGWSRAEDMTQEAFLALLQWKQTHCVCAWLRTCLRHRCLDILRREALEIEVYNPDAVAAASASRFTPNTGDFPYDIQELIDSCLPRVPRFVIMRAYSDNARDVEIAEELEMSAVRVGQIRKRALEHLRAAFQETE